MGKHPPAVSSERESWNWVHPPLTTEQGWCRQEEPLAGYKEGNRWARQLTDLYLSSSALPQCTGSWSKH